MNRPPKQIVSRLGPVGMGRALDDLLDQAQLVQLANSCGIKYPGMRTQSQKRERLLADLVKETTRHEVARKAVVRALAKEVAQAQRDWADLADDDKATRLCDETFLLADGNLGLHLYLLAAASDSGPLGGVAGRLARQYLLRIASNGTSPEPAKGTARGEGRLKKKVAQLEKKVRHIETQLAKSRESQKTIKRDLIQRKGELAESRMLSERLRQELAAAQATAEVASSAKGPPAAPDKAVGELTKSVKKLQAEQRKVVHRIEKLQAAATGRGDGNQLGKLETILLQLAKDVAGDRTAQTKAFETQSKRMEQVRAAVLSQRAALQSQKPRAKRAASKGQARRVGVFVDVQNMYYAARQLKGKLDFDALMQAAVQDRRLIQATAYVVESKETNQSQFIARLEQRAIEVRRKNLQVRADGSMKGDWDMELALDILDAAPRLDVVVLVSGDGDFTSLVKRVKNMGPRVEVIAFPRNTAKALVEAADSFQPLDRKFMIYTRRKKKPESKPADEPQVKPAAKAG